MKFLEDNIKFYLLITIITFISYFQLFLKGNFFNFYELDIHVLYDYLFRSNLNGWRLDKILGTNMLIGDPSFHAWSFLSLIYKIPLINKILLHNIIFLIINLYASFSLFYLITYSNPKLNKYYASLISSLIFLSILRLEFNYVFSWALVFPTIILSTITLFNFFKTNHHKYIFKLFMIYFIGFNFGSIFVIQQSLIFMFIKSTKEDIHGKNAFDSRGEARSESPARLLYTDSGRRCSCHNAARPARIGRAVLGSV